MAWNSAIDGRLRLRAFGATEVCLQPGGAVSGLGAKACAILFLLIEEAPRPMTREAVADHLWDRVDPSQGRVSLRKEISLIKRRLGADWFSRLFDIGNARLAIRPDAIDYDGATLVAAAASDDPNELARILDLYTGPFLADSRARAATFQDWAADRRRAYEESAISGLSRLLESDLAAENHARALKTAEHLLAIDQVLPIANEAVIRIHRADGRFREARRHFEKYRRLSLSEHGEDPPAEIAALAALGGASRAQTRRRPPTVAADNRPVVAVLDVTGAVEPERRHLASGVIEEVIASLARSSWLRVATPASPAMPRAGEVDQGQRDLRDFADYALRVGALWSEKDVQLRATLQRVGDNACLRSIERVLSAEHSFAFQRAVAHRIVASVEPLVLEDQGVAARAEAELKAEAGRDDPIDLEHWRLLMQAHWLFWTAARENNARAQQLLAKALSIKPADARSNIVMAFSHMLDGWTGWSGDTARSIEEARRYGGAAVKVGPNDAWAQFTLGVACSTHDRLAEAEARQRRALELAPALAVALGELGRIRAFSGDVDGALESCDRAMELSPYDHQYGLWSRTKAIARYTEGDIAAALTLIDEALIVRPNWFQNHYLRAAILSEMGRAEDAMSALAEGRRVLPVYPLAALRAGHPFAEREQFDRFVGALNAVGTNY